MRNFMLSLHSLAFSLILAMPASAADDARGPEKSPQTAKEVQLGSMEATQAKTAFLGFRFINDGRLPTTDDEKKRLSQIETTLKAKLAESGKYSFVDVSPEMRKTIETGQDIAQCGGCGTEYGKQLGATTIAWGTVQKVSNLILNINVYMANVDTQRVTFMKSVDIRGNTDETWDQGINYMTKYILKKTESAETEGVN